MLVCCFINFFFFKQKTAYEMRISDWSSDVCSSDLGNATFDIGASPVRTFVIAQRVVERRAQSRDPLARTDHAVARDAAETAHDPQIGRASCRESVCQYV